LSNLYADYARKELRYDLLREGGMKLKQTCMEAMQTAEIMFHRETKLSRALSERFSPDRESLPRKEPVSAAYA
jgi:hypothetical protein